MLEVIKEILRSSNRVTLNFPYAKTGKIAPYFGDSELSDILSFGFSYVEHEDHCVECLLVTPKIAKKICSEIDTFDLTVDTDFLGYLWTARVLVTDKIPEDLIVFANKDNSVVLYLNTNKMEVWIDADL